MRLAIGQRTGSLYEIRGRQARYVFKTEKALSNRVVGEWFYMSLTNVKPLTTKDYLKLCGN